MVKACGMVTFKTGESNGLPRGHKSTLNWGCTQEGKEKGNVLFKDALNTLYLRLYGLRHMVKDRSDSDRGNPLPPHRQLFLISSKDSFICIIPQTG